MKTVTIKVKNCRGCPFSEVRFEDDTKFHHYNCLAPIQIHSGIYQIKSYYKNYKSPSWCPLKKQNLKIEFEK